MGSLNFNFRISISKVSFVNSISTDEGGTYVNNVTDKIVKVILEKLENKNKQLKIKPQYIKQHLWVFVYSQIENPTFDSQTKEILTSKKEDFGSSFELIENSIKKVLKTNIIDRCLIYPKTREDEKNLRKLNGKIIITKGDSLNLCPWLELKLWKDILMELFLLEVKC